MRLNAKELRKTKNAFHLKKSNENIVAFWMLKSVVMTYHFVWPIRPDKVRILPKVYSRTEARLSQKAMHF